ncbi:MAG: MFS transporter [Candidatus Izemoplasmataceae bacterium]
MGFNLMKKKDFGLLIVGKFVSMIGSNMQQFALALYVYALTGSALIFSTMLSISILPRLLMSPVAGVFGDWFDRKKMIVRLDILNAVILGIFAYIFYVNSSFNLVSIYTLVISLELTEIFYESSSAGIIPSIVNKERMAEARSLESMVLSIARLLSPMIAAVIYGASGMFLVLVVNAISFLLSGLSEVFIHVPENHKRPDKINMNAFFVDVKEGLKIIKNNKFIRTVISLGTIVNFVIAPFFSVGFIVLIKEVLAAADYHYGIFQTVMALSMVTGPIVVSFVVKKIEVGKLCTAAFFIVSFIVLSVAIVPSTIFLSLFNGILFPFIFLMVLSFGLGVTISIVNISIMTLFSEVVPLHAMGRTSTVLNLLVTIAIPIGQILFGFLYDTIFTSYVIIISGMIMLFAIIIFRKPMLQVTDKEDVSTKDSLGGQMAYEI